MKSVRELTLLSLLTTLLFVQEQLLSFLPNIQLSVFLVVLYTRLLSFRQVTYIIFIHVLLDNLFMGGLTLTYTPAMFLAWMMVPILLNTVFLRLKSVFLLSLFGFFFGIIYGVILAIGTVLVTGVPLIPYLISDLPWQFVMAIANFLSILWLYQPIYEFLKVKLHNYRVN